MGHAPFQRWWNFVHCQNFQGRYEVGKPETALKCANTAGLDWETSGVGACAGLNGDGTGEEGVRLLRESVRATEQMGIKWVLAQYQFLDPSRVENASTGRAAR